MIVEGSAREPVIVVAIGSNNCSEAVVGKGDWVRECYNMLSTTL